MTRKIGVLLLAAVLMIAVCSVASATLYYVTGNNVRVRSGPGTDYDILSHLNRGDKIDVISTSGGWALMTLWSGSDNGYISTKYISRNKPSSSTNTSTSQVTNGSYQNFQTANYYVIVNPQNTYVNMRWEASKASPVRRIYYYGAQLKVLAENSSWCQVLDESTGEVGFMMKSLLLRI
ncbi:MAG: SH3 domain-containing protein [Clostridia bacterium]|nr:SH3 domain-containing protein [Clostridia bacterium]